MKKQLQVRPHFLLLLASTLALTLVAQDTAAPLDIPSLQRENAQLQVQVAQLLKRAMQCEYKDVDAAEKNATGKLAAIEEQQKAKLKADTAKKEGKTAEVPKKP